jgi:hypothetical protein
MRSGGIARDQRLHHQELQSCLSFTMLAEAGRVFFLVYSPLAGGAVVAARYRSFDRLAEMRRTRYSRSGLGGYLLAQNGQTSGVVEGWPVSAFKLRLGGQPR